MIFLAGTNKKVSGHCLRDLEHMEELAQGMLNQVVLKAPSASQEEKLKALGEQKPQEGACEQGSVVSSFANTDAVCNRISQNIVLNTASKYHDQHEEGPDPETETCPKTSQSQGEQDEGLGPCSNSSLTWIRTTKPGSSESLAHSCNRIHDRSQLLLREPSHPTLNHKIKF